MRFTQIPSNMFKQLQLNAGVIASKFTPGTATLDQASILGATTGGITFSATPTYTDFGEDIDNCPKNMKELKKLDSWEVKLSGTYATVSSDLAKLLIGASYKAIGDSTRLAPRNELSAHDFNDAWYIGDYSDVNTGDSAGFLAIHIMNALSTGGFQFASTDKGKGHFDFELTGHYSIDRPETPPFEVYVKAGTATEKSMAMDGDAPTVASDEAVSDGKKSSK